MYDGLISLVVVVLGIIGIELLLFIHISIQHFRAEKYREKLHTKIGELSAIPAAQLTEHIRQDKALASLLRKCKRRHWRDDLLDILFSVCDQQDAAHAEIIRHCVSEVKILPYLQKLLDHESLDMQCLACYCLSRLGSIANVEKIFDRALSEDGSLQQTALVALCTMGDQAILENYFLQHHQDIRISIRSVQEALLRYPGDMDALLGVLMLKGNEYIKNICLRVAVQTQNRSLEPYYAAGLRSNDLDLRIATIRAVSEAYAPIYERRMIALLEDPNWEVRLAAVQCMGKNGSPQALDGLGELTSDSAWVVRIASSKAILQIEGGEAYANFLLENSIDSYGQQAISAALKEMRHRNTPEWI